MPVATPPTLLHEAMREGLLVRAINFHNAPRSWAAAYASQLEAAGRLYAPIDEAGLVELLAGAPWTGARPPLMPVIYEGYRNAYDVLLPLVERAGLRAWVFVITGFLDAPVRTQRAFADGHWIDRTAPEEEPSDGRLAMTWDELRDVAARGHVIASHTTNHAALADVRSSEDAQRELVGSRRRLEEQLDREVRTLAWLWGAPYGEDPRVDRAVSAAGYRLVFSNASVQRVPEG